MRSQAQDAKHPPVDLEYIDKTMYFQLALSTRKLVRSDKRHLGLRGLLDPALGKCYVISETDLFASIAPRIATS